MIFDHLFPQKMRRTLTLVKIIVHREMQNLAVRVVIPVLRTVCGKNGMLCGENKRTARNKTAIDSFCHRIKRRDVVQG